MSLLKKEVFFYVYKLQFLSKYQLATFIEICPAKQKLKKFSPVINEKNFRSYGDFFKTIRI